MCTCRRVMEKWGFVDEWRLARSYSSKVCMTCQHFSYGVDAHCHTLLGCTLLGGLLQNGDHLTQRCEHWSAVTEMKAGGNVTA